MFRAAVLAIAASLLATSGCMAQGQGGGAPKPGPSPKPKETAEQKAVREYLKENLDSGKFEEVKWWPVRDNNHGDLLVRFKYRTTNRLGAQQLFDDGFRIDKKTGKLVEWRKDGGKLFIPDQKP